MGSFVVMSRIDVITFKTQRTFQISQNIFIDWNIHYNYGAFCNPLITSSNSSTTPSSLATIGRPWSRTPFCWFKNVIVASDLRNTSISRPNPWHLSTRHGRLCNGGWILWAPCPRPKATKNSWSWLLITSLNGPRPRLWLELGSLTWKALFGRMWSAG